MDNRSLPQGGGCCGSGSSPDVRRVEVGGEPVGITGLDAVLEQLYLMGRQPQDDVAAELLDMVRMRNYIPRGTEKMYATALLREYAAYCKQRELARCDGA